MIGNQPNTVQQEKVSKTKKKKGDGIDLYTAVQSKQTQNKFTYLPVSQASGLHSNAARWNEILQPKTFIVKKKKKKRLTVFKKKLLMVRQSIAHSVYSVCTFVIVYDFASGTSKNTHEG